MNMTPRFPQYLPDLTALEYDPERFKNIHESEYGQLIWQFLIRPDNVIRIETACELDRPAVEALAKGLLEEFGADVAEDRIKQYIGHATRRILESRGYVLDRQGIRITRENLFTSASRYRAKSESSMMISRESREKYLERTANGPFNRWLNPQVRDSDGKLNREKLLAVAREWGIHERYDHLNDGHVRMVIGVRLRAIVPPEKYTPTAETQDAN